MKLEVKMCHSQLMAMLMKPIQFQRAVYDYRATTPDVEHEGMAGYIETVVTFNIRDLELFTSLFTECSLVTPEWYKTVRDSLLCNQ